MIFSNNRTNKPITLRTQLHTVTNTNTNYKPPTPFKINNINSNMFARLQNPNKCKSCGK